MSPAPFIIRTGDLLLAEADTIEEAAFILAEYEETAHDAGTWRPDLFTVAELHGETYHTLPPEAVQI